LKTCAPPDPHTRAPKFKAPANACDAHCHVFGPGAVFPYSAGRSYTPPDAPLAAFRALHEAIGIKRAVLVQASVHGTDNTAMLDAIAASGGLYRGVAMVDDTFTDAGLQALHEGGVRAIRFNFVRHLGGIPDLGLFQRMIERVAPLGWHLVLHLDADNIVEFGDLFRKIRIPIVIDHMGRVKSADGLDQPPFRILLDFLANDNCWVKVSGAERIASPGRPITDAVPFARALIEAAPDRVLWGTDWPHPNVPPERMPNDGDLVDLLPLYAPEPDLLHKLLVANPQRLYDFGV
jgi:predicted TIM-barrel fold metal-dependent hydrolase